MYTHNPKSLLIRSNTGHVMYHIPQDTQINSPNLTVEEELLPGINCKLSSFEASNCNKAGLICRMEKKSFGELRSKFQ